MVATLDITDKLSSIGGSVMSPELTRILSLDGLVDFNGRDTITTPNTQASFLKERQKALITGAKESAYSDFSYFIMPYVSGIASAQNLIKPTVSDTEVTVEVDENQANAVSMSAFKPNQSTVEGKDTPEQQEETLTVSMDDNGNPEYHELWEQAKLDGNSTYDPSLFNTELSEDTLILNESFQSAAETLYNDSRDKGEPTWAEHVQAEGWDEDLAKQKLGEWGLNKAGNLTHKSWDAGVAAFQIGDKPKDVQLATLFMIQAFDHKSASAKSTLLALGKSMADPVNVALMVGGFAAGFFTFGTSAAGASALVAARTAGAKLVQQQGIKAMTKMVIQNAMTKTTAKTILQTSFVRGAVPGAIEGIAHDYAIQHTLEEAGYNKLGRDHEYSFSRGATTVAFSAALGGTLNEVTSGLGRKAAKLKAKGADAKVDAKAKADAQIDAEAKAQVDDVVEIDAPKSDAEASVNAEKIDIADDVQEAAPEVKADTAQVDAPVENVNAAPDASPDAAPSEITAGVKSNFDQAVELSEKGFDVEFHENGTIKSVKKGQSGAAPDVNNGPTQTGATAPASTSNGAAQTGTVAQSNGSQTGANAPSNAGNNGGSSQNGAAAGGPTVKPTGVKSPKFDDIEKPKFDPQTDRLKFWSRRSFNPLRGFTRYTPISAYQVRSQGNTRPVIKAVDDQLQALGLVGKLNGTDIEKGTIHAMQDNILDAIESGKPYNLVDKLDDFASKNEKELKHLQATINDLRSHINDTYGFKDPKTGKMVGSDESTKKYGLNNQQKKAMLKYLDGIQDMAFQLEQGSKGAIFKEMRDNIHRINNGDFSADDVRNSVTGLSRANFLSNNAFARQTDRWATPIPNSDLTDQQQTIVTMQWRKSLENHINVGFIDNNSHIGAPLSYEALATENLEETWQNQVLSYAKRGDDGKPEQNWKNPTDPAMGEFIGRLEQFYEHKHGDKAISSVETLKRLAHPWGGKKVEVVPSGAQLLAGFQKREAYLNDPAYKEWADSIVTVAKKQYKGAVDNNWFGLIGRFKENNRPNQHAAITNAYFWEYLTGYEGSSRGLQRGAKPGLIHIRNKFIYSPFQRTGAYILGSKDSTTLKSTDWGTKTENYGLAEITWRDADAKEGIGSNIRRSATRILSVGLVNDLSLNPFKMPSKLGWGAAAGGTVWGIGEMTEQEWLASLGEGTFDLATYPADFAYSTVFGLVGEQEALDIIREQRNDDGTLTYGNYPEAVIADAAAAMDSANSEDHATYMAAANTAHNTAGVSNTGGNNASTAPANTGSGSGSNSNTQTTTPPTTNTSTTAGSSGAATSSTNITNGASNGYISNGVRSAPGSSNVSGWDSAGNLLSGAGNFIAAPYRDLGVTGGAMDDVGNVLSSSASWIARNFKAGANGQYGRETQQWMTYGGAFAASMVIAPWIGDKLGPLNVLGVGTLVAMALITGYGGKLGLNLMDGQGPGLNMPSIFNGNASTNHNGQTPTVTPTPINPHTIAEMDDSAGTRRAVQITDEDMNAKYAIQTVDAADTTKHMKMMEFLSQAAVNNPIVVIDRAKDNNRFISEAALDGLASPSNYEGEVISSGGVHGDIMVLRPEGTNNADQYMVLDVSG